MPRYPLVRSKEGWLLDVHVQPRASRDEVVGVHGDALKIRLCAPPVEGKANDALIAFLAELLGVPRRELAICSGATARRKTVRLPNMAADALARALGLPDAPPPEPCERARR